MDVSKTRDDPPDGDWVWGNLTWQDGKGAIRWGPADSTGPLAGHGPGQAAALVDEFNSTPVETPLYLDASRLVKLDLLAKYDPAALDPQPCANVARRAIRVELLADGRLLAGAISATVPIGAPAAPSGFEYCRYRMPLEQAHIPKGAVLTLRLSYPDQERYQYGTSEATPSILRIPVFPPEEALYRMPEVIPRVRPAPVPDTATGAIAPLIGIGGISLCVLVPSRRSQRSLPLVAILPILLLGFAGCLHSQPRSGPIVAPGASTNPVVVHYEEPGDTGLANESAGSIVGQAFEPYGMPVVGAAVALLSTPRSTTTDEYGLFSFKELAPGMYQLHVDAAGYGSVEASVNVRPSKITRVSIGLDYDASLQAGERPHIHDYWNGANETTVFTAPVYAECPTAEPRCSLADGFFTRPTSEDTNLIRPGTSEVEVALAFDTTTACYTEYGLAIQDNVDANPANWSVFLPRASGEAFHVKATWETTDVGHQAFSTWTFAVVEYGQPIDDCKGTGAILRDLPGGTTPVMSSVTVKVKRGALPLEPPHPDHWGGAGSLRVASSTTDDESESALWTLECLGHLHESAPFVGESKPILEFPAPDIVPADTAAVRVFVNQTSRNGPGGYASLFDWQLHYKTGATPPEPYYEGTTVYRTATERAVSADGLHWTWAIPLQEGDQDGVYSKKSAWRFVLVASSRELRCADLAETPQSFSFAAWASRG